MLPTHDYSVNSRQIQDHQVSVVVQIVISVRRSPLDSIDRLDAQGKFRDARGAVQSLRLVHGL